MRPPSSSSGAPVCYAHIHRFPRRNDSSLLSPPFGGSAYPMSPQTSPSFSLLLSRMCPTRPSNFPFGSSTLQSPFLFFPSPLFSILVSWHPLPLPSLYVFFFNRRFPGFRALVSPRFSIIAGYIRYSGPASQPPPLSRLAQVLFLKTEFHFDLVFPRQSPSVQRDFISRVRLIFIIPHGNALPSSSQIVFPSPFFFPLRTPFPLLEILGGTL